MRKTFIHSIGILTVVLLITYAQSWGASSKAYEHQIEESIVSKETSEADTGLAVSSGEIAGIDLISERNTDFGKPMTDTRLQIAEVRIQQDAVIFPDGYHQGKAWRTSGTTNDIFYNSGNVGIGMAWTDAKLHMYGSGNVVSAVNDSLGLILQACGGAFSIIGWHTSEDPAFSGYNDLELRANATGTGVYIKKDLPNNVGIGNSNPGTKLDVNGIIQSSTGTNAGEYRLGGSTIINASSSALLEINKGGFSTVAVPNGYFVHGGTSLVGPVSWEFQVHQNGYFGGAVSAAEVYDRTPYPKDLETAYAAVLSMERLPAKKYNENDREKQLDHSKLHEFVRSQDGMHRDLSATVSAQNEVIKDLLKRIEELEASVK